jgi:4-hydroxythreonine-4-phosphate dehydrogenase
VFLKARKGEIAGIVYLYHDQGNIAMKSCYFDEGVVIFFNLPCRVTSPGHGSALDIAGQGIANENSITHTIDTLLEMVRYDMKHS